LGISLEVSLRHGGSAVSELDLGPQQAGPPRGR